MPREHASDMRTLSHVCLPAGGRAQPFYHVLPDPADRPGQAQTYVAQENIDLEKLPVLHSCKPGGHPGGPGSSSPGGAAGGPGGAGQGGGVRACRESLAAPPRMRPCRSCSLAQQPSTAARSTATAGCHPGLPLAPRLRCLTLDPSAQPPARLSASRPAPLPSALPVYTAASPLSPPLHSMRATAVNGQ